MDMPTSLQETKATASLPVLTESFAVKHVDEAKREEMETVRNEIWRKVKTKLQVKFKDGEISRAALNVLEKELVEELEEEAAEDFKADLKRRGKIA
jgi:tRNA(Ser,Leu) C12 N-acetylase TAN1